MGFLQVLQLALVLLANVLGLGSPAVLYSPLAVLDPPLDLGRGQVELAAGSSRRRLALDNLKDQRRLALGDPAPSPRSLVSLPWKATSEQEINGALRSLICSGNVKIAEVKVEANRKMRWHA